MAKVYDQTGRGSVSAAAWFRVTNGKRVRKTVEGVSTVEAWPVELAELEATLQTQGLRYTIDPESGTVNLADGRFIMAPKIKALAFGTLNVRSADYTFTDEAELVKRPIYGDKKGATVEGGALVKRYPNGMVVRFEVAA